MTEKQTWISHIPGATRDEIEAAYEILHCLKSACNAHPGDRPKVLAETYRTLMEAIAARQSEATFTDLQPGELMKSEPDPRIDEIIKLLNRPGISIDRADSILEMMDVLTSVRAICQREGRGTAWQRLDERIESMGIGSVTPKTFRVLPSDAEQPPPTQTSDDLSIRNTT